MDPTKTKCNAHNGGRRKLMKIMHQNESDGILESEKGSKKNDEIDDENVWQ